MIGGGGGGGGGGGSSPPFKRKSSKSDRLFPANCLENLFPHDVFFFVFMLLSLDLKIVTLY
jgi:hypothetical protein